MEDCAGTGGKAFDSKEAADIKTESWRAYNVQETLEHRREGEGCQRDHKEGRMMVETLNNAEFCGLF